MRAFVYGCLAMMVLVAGSAQAVERTAALPYVYGVTSSKLNVPNCATNEVLTHTVDGFVCVSRDTPLPNCATSQFMAVSASGDLDCKSLAQSCPAGQVFTKVVDDTFTCTELPKLTVPTCPSGQVLQGDAKGGLTCVALPKLTVPTCATGKILQGNESGDFVCVDFPKGTPPPKCETGTVLQGNGNGGFVCAELPKVSIPVCPSGQVLQGNGSGGFVCAGLPKPSIPTCASGQMLQGSNDGKFSCVAISPVCSNNQILTNVGGAFQCVALTDRMPKCTAKQALTNDNGTLKCIGVESPLPVCSADEAIANVGGTVKCISTLPKLPVCSAGQSLGVTDGFFDCTTFTSGRECPAGSMALLNQGVTYCVTTSCSDGERLTFVNGKPVCKALPEQNTCVGTAAWTKITAMRFAGTNYVVTEDVPAGGGGPYGGEPFTDAQLNASKVMKYNPGEVVFLTRTNGTFAIPVASISMSGAIAQPAVTCSGRVVCTGRTGWQVVTTGCVYNTPSGYDTQ